MTQILDDTTLAGLVQWRQIGFGIHARQLVEHAAADVDFLHGLHDLACTRRPSSALGLSVARSLG